MVITVSFAALFRYFALHVDVLQHAAEQPADPLLVAAALLHRERPDPRLIIGPISCLKRRS